MTLADSQQQRLLEHLRQVGKRPVAFAELHADGIDFPAAVASELELHGYAIERVYDREQLVEQLVGVRLLPPKPPDTPAAPRRRWLTGSATYCVTNSSVYPGSRTARSVGSLKPESGQRTPRA